MILPIVPELKVHHVERADLRRPKFAYNESLPMESMLDNDYMLSKGAHKTENCKGYSFSKLDQGFACWICSLPKSDRPLLDLGCGLGFQTEAAIKSGRDVIAVDADDRNLEHVRQRVADLHENGDTNATEQHGELVTTKAVTLPNKNAFPKESVCGVLLSEVLHFLGAGKALQLVRDTFTWLQPGGRLIISTMSPAVLYVMEKAGAAFVSGKTIEETWDFVDSSTDEDLLKACPFTMDLLGMGKQSNVPDSCTAFSTYELLALARLSGFEIEFLDYISPEKYPFHFSSGDEASMLVARKPL